MHEKTSLLHDTAQGSHQQVGPQTILDWLLHDLQLCKQADKMSGSLEWLPTWNFIVYKITGSSVEFVSLAWTGSVLG